MKQLYLSIIALITASSSFSQTAIGTTTPDPSAKFEVNSSTQGFLGPRVALTGRDDVSTIKNSSGTTVTPATGLVVFNTATAGTGSNAVQPGYYSFNGTNWIGMSSAPAEVVDGTLLSSFTITQLPFSSGGYGYGPLASISLPPGKWEVTGNFTCLLSPGYGLGFRMGIASGGVPDVNGWYPAEAVTTMNTYWISEDNEYAGMLPQYPLALAGLSPGAPTADKTFSGSNISIKNMSRTQSEQHLKFYLTNNGATNKTYYLLWHESYAGYYFGADDFTNAYAPSTSGSDRFFAVKIQ